MTNKEVLKNVNKKIDKLRMLKKSQEVNHEIKKRKTEKRYDKQMKLIGKELKEELEKQGKLMDATDSQFKGEKTQLQDILEDQVREHMEEREVLIEGKEKNLNFVSNENDELETRILRLKETIVDELEKIEDEHQHAVNELVHTYEQSVKQAQDEVRNTIDKLKQNGHYYENMVKLQEKDYEQEVQKLQSDLIEDHTEFVKRKEKLEQEDNQLKDEYQTLEALYKDRNSQRKQKLLKVQELNGEYKSMFSNLERLGEKNIQSNIFIEEKERNALETITEKQQLENIIAFLSEKIKELKNERMPLESRKQELEKMIQETYRELQEDFQFRKYLELKQESIEKKMEMIKKEIGEKANLKESIEQKNYIFKRELSYLAETQNLRGWTHKMQGMLKCMSEVYFAGSADQVKKISTAFIHIAEIMESNARPYRPSQHEEDTFIKQQKLNEMELAYYRNKSSQKMEEMQIRFKGLFSQMEKAVKKLRNDNIKLIEEFNTLINEKKKLNNLRRMIKESLKEILGEKYTEDKYGSSEEDNFKSGDGTKRRKKKRQKSSDLSQSNIERERGGSLVNRNQVNNIRGQEGGMNTERAGGLMSDTGQSQMMQRSKSQSSFALKHAKILQNIHNQLHKDYLFGNLTERQVEQPTDNQNFTVDEQNNNNGGAGIGLPNLKAAQQFKMSQISLGGSLTTRDGENPDNLTQIKSGALSGYVMTKAQQLMSKRRLINNLTNQVQGLTSQRSVGQDNASAHNQTANKYLERIVDEFEKNKRQIEEQTKALQKIQSLAHVISENQSPQNLATPGEGVVRPDLNMGAAQQQIIANQHQISLNLSLKKKSQSQIRQIGAAPAVPSLNLRKMKLKNEQLGNGLGSMTARQQQQLTSTTRVPVSTERTQAIVSMFHNKNQHSFNSSVIGQQNPGLFNANSRQLPIVREKNTLYQSKESGGIGGGISSFQSNSVGGAGIGGRASAGMSSAQTARDNLSSGQL